MRLKDDFLVYLAVGSVLLFLLHGFGLAWDYSQTSLQMDLSEFYAAGESLRHGLNPYLNNAPTVSTGTDFYKDSGFLYPPLTALLFQPLTSVSYLHFKMLWTFAQPIVVLLVTVICGVWIARASNRSYALAGATLFAMSAMAAYPMRIEMERGQVDLLVLLLVLGALILIEASRHEFLGGLLLGMAPLLKPHAVFIVPFLLCRGRHRALAASALSIALLAGTQILLQPTLTRHYIQNVLPRMSVNSSVGSVQLLKSEEKISPPEFEALVLPDWNTPVRRNGRVYLREGFNGALSAAGNASLPKYLWLSSPLLTYFGQAPLSACVYLALLDLVCIVVWWPAGIRWDAEKTFAFWIMALGLVLLSAPITWGMATISLLPAAFLIPAMGASNETTPRNKALTLALVVTGLVLLVLDERPIYSQLDRRASPMIMQVLGVPLRLIRLKFVIAEVLICAGLAKFVLWGRHRQSARTSRPVLSSSVRPAVS